MAGQENGSPIGQQKTCPNPTCQFDKHTTRANFCILCGTLLYRRCDNCLDENPMYAHFCHYCGANLEELRLERMQQSDRSPVEEASPAAEESDEESGSEGTEDEGEKKNIFDIS